MTDEERLADHEESLRLAREKLARVSAELSALRAEARELSTFIACREYVDAYRERQAAKATAEQIPEAQAEPSQDVERSGSVGEAE